MKTTFAIIITSIIAFSAVFYAGSFYGQRVEQERIHERINTVNKERAKHDKEVLNLTKSERCAILGGRLFSDRDCR